MLWACSGLPEFGRYAGPYGDVLNAVAPAERNMQNVVTAINFDYRGIDTLGEEYMLFAAVAATALLLRRLRTEEEHEEGSGAGQARQAGEELQVWGIGIIACTLLFGVYMVVHGSTSPGGGFQGGCILASAWVVVFLTGDVHLVHRVTSEKGVQFAEALGAGMYAAIGLAMMVLGGVFLQNLLPLAGMGSPLSGGMIAAINAAVGLEVTAGFVLILLEFLRQTTEIGQR
jgi:multicomponent Na+:H+ antiporter subunit B